MVTRPKNLDMNQLAKRILDEATGDEPKTEAPAVPKKNKAAVALGKIGGKKGGAARAAALTPEQRSEIAKKAAAGRWGKTKPPADVEAPKPVRRAIVRTGPDDSN
jgi:hypothetical protein